MKGICPSNKDFYHNKEAAEEALILHLGRNHYAPGAGPINVYKCQFCEGYHFTSKGEPSHLLNDPEVKRRIDLLRQSSEWDY